MVQFHCERPPVFSVTSEAAASLSFQAPPPRSAKPDPSQGTDSFQALIDGSAPSDTGNDWANATAQQQSASQRRGDDARATADTKRSRDAGPADQAAGNNSDDRDATARQRPDAETNANTDAVQQSGAKPNTLKVGTAKPIDKKPADLKANSETASAPDFSSAPDSSTVAASAQQDATSVTTPNPVAVAIAVTIVSTDVPPATPASGNAIAPLAIAAAAIAASSPASAAAAGSPVQIESDSDPIAATTTSAAAGVTVSAAASVPAVVPTTSPDAAANAKVPVQAAASEAAAAPLQQPATQSVTTAATAATDLALTATVAAMAPVEAKTTLLKAPVAAPAKTAASSAADAASGAPDPSAAARAADTPQNNVAPPPAAAARQDADNGRVETAKADAPASSSPASPAAEPAHEHSPINATAHTPSGSSDAGLQATGTVQPQPAPATAASAASLSVTAATNAVVPLSGLALEIAVSARSGKSRFEIRLDPADLGRIDVRIDVDRNGRVTSHLTVEKPETLSMLRQDAPQLQRALDDAGLKTGNGGLQFSLRDQSSSGQDGNETGRNAQRLVISDDETISAAVAGRTYGRVPGSSSGVDIRV
jgi:hypothetical protein